MGTEEKTHTFCKGLKKIKQRAMNRISYVCALLYNYEQFFKHKTPLESTDFIIWWLIQQQAA